MAHTIGRSIPENLTISPGVTNFSPFNDGGVRFVMLRFTNVSLSGSDVLRVNLGYDTDVFTAISGSEVWTRPFNPRIAPIEITLTGSSPVTLREYLIGERTAGSQGVNALRHSASKRSNEVNNRLARPEFCRLFDW